MRILFTLLAVCFFSFTSLAQSLQLEDPLPVVYGWYDAPIFETGYGVFNVRNISNAKVNTRVRAEGTQQLSGTRNNFCYAGVCFADLTRESSTMAEIEPNAADSSFRGDYRGLSNIGTTQVKYTWFVDSDPSDFVEATIDYVTVNEPGITGSTTICPGGSVMLGLDFDHFDTYEWSTGANSPTITVSSAGTYSVTVGLHGVTKETAINITEDASLMPTIAGDLEYCEGGNTTLSGGPGFMQYNWSSGSTGFSNQVTAGTHTLTVTDGNGCTGTASVTVTENPLPAEPTITSSIENDVVTLNSTAAEEYMWFENNLFIYREEGQAFTPEENGSYQVHVVDANGCVNVSQEFSANNVGVEEAFGTTARLSLYPNPASDQLVLELDNVPTENLQFQLFNTNGSLLRWQNVNTSRLELDISNLPAGTYLFNLLNQNEVVESRSVVVSR